MIKKFFDKIRPNFEAGGKWHSLHSLFEGMESFLLVPNRTSAVGVSVHDAIDSKRIMSFVVIAPASSVIVSTTLLTYILLSSYQLLSSPSARLIVRLSSEV